MCSKPASQSTDFISVETFTGQESLNTWSVERTVKQTGLHISRCAVQVAVEDIIADGRLRLAVTPVFDESQLAAALQVFVSHRVSAAVQCTCLRTTHHIAKV